MKAKMQQILSFIRRNKLATKLISFTLSLVLVFYVIPSSIYAEAAELLSSVESGSENTENTNTEDSAPGNNLEINNESAYTVPLYEAEELREESVKHFKLSDGSYIAAQYSSPVHYEDENGIWQDIDNFLSESGAEYSNSNARIKFAKKITGNSSLFTLHDSGTKITLSLIGAIKGTVGAVTNNSDAESDTELQKMLSLENLSSTITYRDILDGVDLEYIAASMNVKENIIVKESKDSYSYSFELKLNGLEATLEESGDILIRLEGTNEVKYIIPAPVVYDSNGIHAPEDKVYYTLTHENGKKYTLTITAESEWMNSDERAFPITIDPAIVSARSSIVDTYITSARPTTANYTTTSLYVSDSEYAYVKSTTLPTISPAAYISNATITMRRSLSIYTVYVGVYKVISDWDSTLSWNTYSNSTPPVGQIDASVVDYVIIDDIGSYSWNITSVAKDWYNGENNYGVAFKGLSGSNNVSFYSDDYTVDYSYCPTLTITYRDMKGIEDYWSYSSHSAGVAGDGYVNLATGNLVLDIPTISAPENLFGYIPTLTYDSALAGLRYSSENSEAELSTACMPYGFKLGVFESIIKKEYTDTEETSHVYYIFSDANGTEHAFYPTNEEATEFADEDGLKYILTLEDDEKIKITDANHYVRTFEKITYGTSAIRWRLTSIEDHTENMISFLYNSNNTPSSITLTPYRLSAITLYRFVYSTANVLCAIYNPNSMRGVVLRYTDTYNGVFSVTSSKYLKSIEHVHNTNTSNPDREWEYYVKNPSIAPNIIVDSKSVYEYNSSGQIISAGNYNSGQKITYTWSNGKVTGVSEYAGTTPGQSLSLAYFDGYTEITNSSNGITNRYVFDSQGRTVSTYSFDGDKIYGAVSGTYDTGEKSKNSLSEKAVLTGVHVNYLANSSFENANAIRILNWTKSGTGIVTAVEAPAGVEHSFDNVLSFPIGTSGNNPGISQTVTLAPGKYTFSMVMSGKSCSAVTGAIELYYSGETEPFHTESILPPPDSLIETSIISTVFEVTGESSQSVTLKISFTATSSNSSAALYIDSLMLAEDVGVCNYSIVNRGNFENGSGLWLNEEGTTPTVVTDDDTFGNAIKVDCTDYGSHYVKQTVYSASDSVLSGYDEDIYLDNPEEYTFTVSGFAKAANATPGRQFRLYIQVVYYRGQNSQDVTLNYSFDFVHSCTDWQFVSGTFTTGYDQSGTALDSYKCVKSITVYCEYSAQIPGTAYFDNISMTFSDTNTSARYYYNSDGQITRYVTPSYREYYGYNDNGDISYTADSNKNLTLYTYGTNHWQYLMIQAASYTYTYNSYIEFPYMLSDPVDAVTKTPKTRTDYSYNNYGLIKDTKYYILNPDATPNSDENILVTIYKYDLEEGSIIFGALVSETDTLGNTTSYFYDGSNGNLLATVNTTSGESVPMGVVYEYDGAGNLIGVKPVSYSYSTKEYSSVTNAENVGYTYDEDTNQLTGIQTATTAYSISYDGFGNQTEVAVGGNTLASYEYYPNNGQVKKVTYANGFVVEYVYNNLEMLSEVWYNEDTEAAYLYEYTASGQLYKLTDNKTGRTLICTYDSNGRLVSTKEERESTSCGSIQTRITYTEDNDVSSIKNTFNSAFCESTFVNYSYFYDDKQVLTDEIITSPGIWGGITYTYDNYDRLSSKSYCFDDFTNSITYSYKEYGECTSEVVETYTSTIGTTTTSYTYTYDNNGNITKITDNNGKTVTYTYDDLGQVIYEVNELTALTYTYTYDKAGNIINRVVGSIPSSSSASTYAINPGILQSTHGYSNSSFGDLLTSYKGVTITYDEIGNPLSYYNGSSYTFTWNGRRLATAVKGDKTMSFAYGDDGLRISKTVNGVTTYYYYDGTLLVAEESELHTIVYIYDVNGSPIGFKCKTSDYATDVWDVYYYTKNLQGDIVAVYSSTGTKLISYVYTAWGSASILYTNEGLNSTAFYNPFRYRGYYYDSDLGMYYLQSRYYDANICRFINADSVIPNVGGDILGYNLYAYCMNNPVNMSDPSGNWPKWVTKLVVAVAIVAVVTVVAAITVATAGTGTAAAVVVVGAAKGAAIGMATGAAIGAGTAAVNHRVSTGDWEGAGEAALNGMADGALSGSITGAITGGIKGGMSYTPKTTASPVSSNTTNTPSIKYPGNDPTKCNIPDFEWRGSGTPASGRGNFVNMKTGEWLHPDLNHGPPIGPHWDYGVRGSSQTFRIFPDGNILPK